MQIKRADTTTAWPTVSFGTWRLWDSRVSWSLLEPQRDTYSWSVLDEDVALAQQHGVEVMLTLGLTPAWASARPTEPCAYMPGNAAPPANMTDWQNFVTTVATRYKGRIKYYEIWNEPNDPQFFSGTPGELAKMAKLAYQAIKAADPAALVVSPPFTGLDTTWMDNYFNWGGSTWLDVVGYHFYSWPSAPEQIISLIGKVKSLMGKYSLGSKPLWNTESGWLIQASQTNVVPESWNTVLTQTQAAAYVAREFLLNLNNGIDRYFFYSWDDSRMGLCEADGVTVKWTASTGYQSVRDWLVGASFLGCTKDAAGTWTCQIARNSSSTYHGWIAWNPTAPGLFVVPAGVTRYRTLTAYTGTATAGSTVTVQGSPVLFEKP